MKTRPIHENLDTSFVNLAALLRYLRRRQFVGHIRIELSGYEADIHLLANDKLQVREQDRIAGRIAEGEEALQRFLIRAREPGGTIHVYQTLAESTAVEAQQPEPKTSEPKSSVIETKESSKEFSIVGGSSGVLPATTINGSNGNGNGNGHKIQTPPPVIAEEKTPDATGNANVSLPDFPFALSNEVENKARQLNHLSPEDWRTLMRLVAELLGTIDKTLAEAKLNFSSAFTKVRAEIAADYPFLDPASGVFDYAQGKMTMREQVSAKLFVASINEALRRILEKLGSSAKFAEIHRVVMQKIIALINLRKPLYQKFFITPQLEKIIAIR